MESAEDRLAPFVVKDENGRFRVIAASVAVAPIAIGALAINSRLLRSCAALSDLSAIVPS